MLTAKQYDDSNIVEFTLDGNVSRREFSEVADEIESVINEHGTVRLVEVIKDVGAIDPAALWEDLKLGSQHLRDFSHVAVVADQQWVDWVSKAVEPLLSAEVRTYKMNEIERARAWIQDA